MSLHNPSPAQNETPKLIGGVSFNLIDAHEKLLTEEKEQCWESLPTDTKKEIEAANKELAEQGRKFWVEIKRQKES